MKSVLSFPGSVWFFPNAFFSILIYWKSEAQCFSLLFMWALDWKWPLYISTCFQFSICWQNLQNSISTDTEKLFGKCSALYFGVDVMSIVVFLPTLPASRHLNNWFRFIGKFCKSVRDSMTNHKTQHMDHNWQLR